ncbi:MAG: hypothetical protein J6T39_02810 [Clostridia bacterium]|nr:hypothetical protein [Clostridia bacterium]
MLKSLLYKTKSVGKYAYIADENNDVYVFRMGNNPYKYEIALATNKQDNLVEETLVKNPTQEQKEYALLNLIILDSCENKNKTGIHFLDLEQICDEFIVALSQIDHENYTVLDMFKHFGLSPRGKYTEIAYNNLIKDVISGRCENVDKQRLEYAQVGRRKVALSFYKKDSNGIINLAKPNTLNYGYRIIEVHPRMEIENKKPTQEQLENALLNVIIEDNLSNPNKSGAYNVDIDEITKVFAKTMQRVEEGKCGKDSILTTFGLDFEGEYINSLTNNLIDDVIKGRTKTEEMEKTL